MENSVKDMRISKKETNIQGFFRRNFKIIIYVFIICVGIVLAVFMLAGRKKKTETISLKDDGYAIADFSDFSTAVILRANRLRLDSAEVSEAELKALLANENELLGRALVQLKAGQVFAVREDGVYSGSVRLCDTSAAIMNNGAYILLTGAVNNVINEDFTRRQLVRGNYIFSGALYYENLEKTTVTDLFLCELQDGYYVVLQDFSIKYGNTKIVFEESDIVYFSKRDIYRTSVRDGEVKAERFIAGDMSVVAVKDREYFYDDFLEYLGKTSLTGGNGADSSASVSADGSEGNAIGSYSGVGEITAVNESGANAGPDNAASNETVSDSTASGDNSAVITQEGAASDSSADAQGTDSTVATPKPEGAASPQEIISAERFTEHTVYQYYMGKRLEYGLNNRINEVKGELYSVNDGEYAPVFGTPLFYRDDTGMGAYLTGSYELFDYSRCCIYRLPRYTRLECRDHVVLVHATLSERTHELADSFLYDGAGTYIFPVGITVTWGENFVNPEGLSMVSLDDGILYIYDLSTDRLLSYAVSGQVGITVIPAEGITVEIGEASVYRGTECLADLGSEPDLYSDYFE